MSSEYRILCLSHHGGALELNDMAWHSSQDGRAKLEGRLALDAPPVSGHEGCDLVGGRFSYPLVEVYCPPRPPGPKRHGCTRWWHGEGQWADVRILRLQLAVQWQAPHLLDGRDGHLCWQPDRLTHLAGMLDPEGKLLPAEHVRAHGRAASEGACVPGPAAEPCPGPSCLPRIEDCYVLAPDDVTVIVTDLDGGERRPIGYLVRRDLIGQSTREAAAR